MVSPQSYNMGNAVPPSVPTMQQQNSQMTVQMQQQVKVCIFIPEGIFTSNATAGLGNTLGKLHMFRETAHV